MFVLLRQVDIQESYRESNAWFIFLWTSFGNQGAIFGLYEVYCKTSRFGLLVGLNVYTRILVCSICTFRCSATILSFFNKS